MLPVSRFSNRWVRWGVVLGFWTWLAFFFATKDYFGRRSMDMEVNWTKALWWKAMEWYGWAVLSLIVFWVCRTFYDPEKKWWRYIGIHVVLGTIISLAHVGICATGAIIEGTLKETGHTWTHLTQIVFFNHFHFDWFVYAAIVSVWHAMDSYRRFRDREVQAIALEARLARSQLQMLKTQLQPHFLFNTLHGISALNHEDPKGANRMLARLSSLLRLTLEQDSAQEVSLEAELEFLGHYLEIEKVRLGDRLTVKMDIAPDTLEASVPNLLLQPIVENAIRHAISPYAAPGHIWITSSREKGVLSLIVRDSGPGLTGQPLRLGVGLTNTQERLRQLYGEKSALDLANSESGGLTVTVSLPFRPKPTASDIAVPHAHR
ncbi:MAG: yehU 2 [Verrucomicrobiales bacterium]|nr:yehU 2 [Verrucomicrobiales bacterium]